MNTSSKKTFTMSKITLFIGIAVVALVSFVAGTREQEWQALIGSITGIKSSTDTLDVSSLQQTYRYLDANFDGTLDKQALIDGANHGMVAAAGDKYTVYFTQKEAKAFSDDLSGNIGAGIGAQIEERNGQPTIGRILANNPASTSGLKQGDVITAVNDESSVGWTADQAVSKIKGEAGTSVKLTVTRSDATLNFTMTRAVINNPSVSSSIENNIGTLIISRFDSETGSLAQKAAEKFKQAGVKGVIIDIRSDGGGYVDAAVSVASLWLKDKTIVTQKKDGKIIDQQKSSGDAPLHGIKTVVLINGGSASASEILASSLKDNGAATLIGEKSFGKGSVQSPIDLANGALLKVTVAKWYTPNDQNISGKGLTPDVVVPLVQADIDAGTDPQLEAAKKALQ